MPHKRAHLMRLRFGIATAVGLLMSMTIATGVGAVEPASPPATTPTASQPANPLVPDSILVPRRAKGDKTVQATAGFGGNPYGCIGRSDYPHMSTHVSGTADARGVTQCSTPMIIIKVTSKLFKNECFFAVCWWTLVRTTWNDNGTTYVEVNPAYRCNDFTTRRNFRIESHHEVRGPNLVNYTADTANQSPSPLACG
jgi:hypothetical protein